MFFIILLCSLFKLINHIVFNSHRLPRASRRDISLSLYIYIYIEIFINVCLYSANIRTIYIYIYIYTYLYLYLSIYLSLYLSIYIYIYVCIMKQQSIRFVILQEHRLPRASFLYFSYVCAFFLYYVILNFVEVFFLLSCSFACSCFLSCLIIFVVKTNHLVFDRIGLFFFFSFLCLLLLYFIFSYLYIYFLFLSILSLSLSLYIYICIYVCVYIYIYIYMLPRASASTAMPNQPNHLHTIL